MLEQHSVQVPYMHKLCVCVCVLVFHNDFTAPCRCIMTSKTILCPRLLPDLHVVAREQAEDF